MMYENHEQILVLKVSIICSVRILDFSVEPQIISIAWNILSLKFAEGETNISVEGKSEVPWIDSCIWKLVTTESRREGFFYTISSFEILHVLHTITTFSYILIDFIDQC